MNYELAKQLKEAGFPQVKGHPISKYYREGDPGYIYTDKDVPKYFILVPTLSELIEACGDNFQFVEKIPNNLEYNWPAWTAISNERVRAFGTLPEEAVARLWLKLNKTNI